MICAEKCRKNQGIGGREEGVDFLDAEKTLSDMTEGAVHQGFVLRVSEFAYADLSVILEKAEQEENPLILILDGLTDPTTWARFYGPQMRLR